MIPDRAAHWQGVYTAKAEAEVSWFQAEAAPSLAMIGRAGGPGAAVVDIGGGASRLVDGLLALGHTDITVLDLSAAALETARARLGPAGQGVRWVAADVTAWQPPAARFDIWHDRAAFHFLTEAADRAAYVAALCRALRPHGQAIIATFAPDGPEKCSGLPVMRHDADSLARELGPGFTLCETFRHDHATPWGSVQRFQFSRFARG